jgi:hypothetical protein
MSGHDEPKQAIPAPPPLAPTPVPPLPHDAMLLLGEIAGAVRALPDQLAMLNNAQARLEMKVDQNNAAVFERVNDVHDTLAERIGKAEGAIGAVRSKQSWFAGVHAAMGLVIGAIVTHLVGLWK